MQFSLRDETLTFTYTFYLQADTINFKLCSAQCRTRRLSDLGSLCKQTWWATMRCIHVAVVVFSLLSGGQSAPVTGCETLTQPIEIKGRDQVRNFHVTCLYHSLPACWSLFVILCNWGRHRLFQLLGKWMFVAESTNIIGSKLLTKMFVESAWARISAANESDAITVFQAQKM